MPRKEEIPFHITHVEDAMKELKELHESNVIAKHTDMVNKIKQYNQLLVDNNKEITLREYIFELRKLINPTLNISYLYMFASIYDRPTLINADLLGPAEYNILELLPLKQIITAEQIQSLMDKYSFKKDIDYFIKEDVLDHKVRRSIYAITPYVLRICLTDSTHCGRNYKEYYSFLELCIHEYTNYQILLKK